MRRSTLPRTGWAHPYGHGPFSPFLYADGGDGGDSGSSSTGDGADTGSGDSGTDDGDGSGTADASSDADAGEEKPKPKPAAGKPPAAAGDQAAEIARLTKELTAARAEAGKERTTAKETAAQEAKAALVQDLGKMLGLIQDEKAPAPTVEQLTAQIEKATAAHRETATELAVFKGAAKHGADPSALTDSRGFMAQLAKLDPAADDFAKKVSAAIEKAVADNPKLAAAQARTDSGTADFTGSTGDKPTDGPQDIDTIRAERRKRRAG